MNSAADNALRAITRRHFFSNCGIGLGALALASLLDSRAATVADPLAPKAGHFPARAKNVIFLFMAGGPSQLELFDYKPKLVELNGKSIPDSFIAGKRFAFMDSSFKDKTKLLGTRRQFKQYGQSGVWVSELMPHHRDIVDDATFLMGCATDVFNHAPAKLFMNT